MSLIERDTRDILRVKKISHATYDTPDLDGQIDYYTDVLGLTLTAREKDAAFLASTLEHHSVVLRQGGSGNMGQCARLGFQVGLDDDLAAFEKQTAAQGIKTQRKSDPEPSIKEMVTFEDPKGTVMEVFKRADTPPQKFPTKGIVPHKLGHVAFFVKDVKKVTDFYCNVLGFRRLGLDGQHVLIPAVRHGPPHHQPDAGPGGPPLPHRVRAARLGPHADGLRHAEPQRLQAAVGTGPPRHRPQPVHLSPRAERAHH